MGEGAPEEFEADGTDHEEEDDAHEMGSAFYHEVRPETCAQGLADAHEEAWCPKDLSGESKDAQGGEVAGGVHGFGVSGGLG